MVHEYDTTEDSFYIENSVFDNSPVELAPSGKITDTIFKNIKEEIMKSALTVRIVPSLIVKKVCYYFHPIEIIRCSFYNNSLYTNTYFQ